MSDDFRNNITETQNRRMQAYRSLKNYPVPEPKNLYNLNPLCLNSLKTLDVDDLQEIFGKDFQNHRSETEGKDLLKEVIINDSVEIKEVKDAIEHAKLNQILARQMNQNLLLRKQKLMKEAEEEELVLQELENEKRKKQEEEEKKKQAFLANREINLKQIREKERLKIEADKEYERDKKLLDEILKKMRDEDLAAKAEEDRKKEINKLFMKNAFDARQEYKKKEKEKDKQMDEEIKKYNEMVKQRENNIQQKKNELQLQKDKIFNKLCDEEAKRKAEQDYWDNVRTELHTEQEIQKTKQKQKEEELKRQKMKEDVMNSALNQMKLKAQRKKEEEELDEKIRQKMLEKFAEDEKFEKAKQEKQKQQLIDIQNEIKKQRELKYQQYQKQKEQELQEFAKMKEEEDARKYIIEQEKRRLLKENEELLKKYYPSGYYKVVDSLQEVKKTNTKHDIIYNNIFGNSNPNKSSNYPKYGNIKNFVYDIGIQDVHPNINIVNYPMYNATANNNYDSYPSPEEYKKMMDQTGQLNYAYAGGPFVKGVPMRSQKPVFKENFGLKTQFSVRKNNAPSLTASTLGNNTMGGTSYSNRGSNVGEYLRSEGNFVPQASNSLEKGGNYNNVKVAEAMS